MGISAGPAFKINPTISFMLNFDPSENKDARKDLDALWEKLSDGGNVLMKLDKYPTSASTTAGSRTSTACRGS